MKCLLSLCGLYKSLDSVEPIMYILTKVLSYVVEKDKDEERDIIYQILFESCLEFDLNQTIAEQMFKCCVEIQERDIKINCMCQYFEKAQKHGMHVMSEFKFNDHSLIRSVCKKLFDRISNQVTQRSLNRGNGDPLNRMRAEIDDHSVGDAVSNHICLGIKTLSMIARVYGIEETLADDFYLLHKKI